MLSVASSQQSSLEDISPTTLLTQSEIIKIKKELIPAPKVGDKIFVPTNENPPENIARVIRRLIGGYGHVSRVVCCRDENHSDGPLHYLYIGEHSGYVEYKWEGQLDEMQEELSNKFSVVDLAYIKPL